MIAINSGEAGWPSVLFVQFELSRNSKTACPALSTAQASSTFSSIPRHLHTFFPCRHRNSRCLMSSAPVEHTAFRAHLDMLIHQYRATRDCSMHRFPNKYFHFGRHSQTPYLLGMALVHSVAILGFPLCIICRADGESSLACQVPGDQIIHAKGW